jgi:hypothetical protein
VPIVVITQPFISTTAASAITLDGTHSFSPNANALKYFWDINNSSNALDVLPANFFTQVNQVDFYTANLTVTDAVTGEFSVASARIELIGPSAGAVPEPATWALMLVGFGITSASIRYRGRSVKAVYA